MNVYIHVYIYLGTPGKSALYYPHSAHYGVVCCACVCACVCVFLYIP